MSTLIVGLTVILIVLLSALYFACATIQALVEMKLTYLKEKYWFGDRDND